MKKRVYLVSTGEYSEYSILGAFSTRGIAMEFRDTFPSMGARIEGMILDEFENIMEACRGKKIFCVEMALVDGTVKNIKEETGKFWAAQMVLENKLVMNSGLIIAYVFANVKEHAVKIVAELRRQVVVQMNTDEGQ